MDPALVALLEALPPTSGVFAHQIQTAVEQLNMESLDAEKLQLVLQSSAWHGNTVAVAALLTAGVDVNAVRPGVDSALIIAASSANGNVRCVELLLKARADANHPGWEGATALIAACKGGHVEMIELLLAARATIDLPAANRDTPLLIASFVGWSSVVELLLNANADASGATSTVSATSAAGTASPTSVHAPHGWPSDYAGRATVPHRKALARLSSDPTASPLYAAAVCGHARCVELLLERRAAVDEAGIPGETPLLGAIDRGHTACAALLIQANAAVGVVAQRGVTPLVAASFHGHAAIARLLVEAQAAVDVGDGHGGTPLLHAAIHGHVDCVALLLAAKADPRAAGASGETPLMAAGIEGRSSVVQLLLDTPKDDPNAAERRKRLTPRYPGTPPKHEGPPPDPRPWIAAVGADELTPGAMDEKVRAVAAAKARRESRSERWPPVDVVITWVDTTDAAWRRDFEAAAGRPFADGQRWSPVVAGPEAELATCLELVRRHLPWVRRTYVLTRRPQVPECLQPGEVVVFHEAVGLRGATFNSHAIEASLHLLPGLSEHFLYLNDDFYVKRPCSRRRFFAEGMRPIVRDEPIQPGGDESWAKVMRYTAAVARTKTAALIHAPLALSRSMLRIAERQLPRQWAITRACPLRYEREGEIVPLLAATQLALQRGDAKGAPEHGDLCCVYTGGLIGLAPDKDRRMKKAHVVCVNSLDVPRAGLRAALGVAGVE